MAHEILITDEMMEVIPGHRRIWRLLDPLINSTDLPMKVQKLRKSQIFSLLDSVWRGHITSCDTRRQQVAITAVVDVYLRVLGEEYGLSWLPESASWQERKKLYKKLRPLLIGQPRFDPSKSDETEKLVHHVAVNARRRRVVEAH